MTREDGKSAESAATAGNICRHARDQAVLAEYFHGCLDLECLPPVRQMVRE